MNPIMELPLYEERGSASPALQELRALRDMYARRAQAALMRRWPARSGCWSEFISDTVLYPYFNAELIRDMLYWFTDMREWAALDRFPVLAIRCFEMEQDELCYAHGGRPDGRQQAKV